MRLNELRSLIESVKNGLKDKPKKDVDYTFVFDGHKKDDVATIKLLKGKYAGVVYAYSKVSVADKENEDGTLYMSFEFVIVDPNGIKESTFSNNKKFEKTIGDILTSMIIESAITTSMEELKNEEAGDNYTEEPDTRRRVREKGSAVSE